MKNIKFVIATILLAGMIAAFSLGCIFLREWMECKVKKGDVVTVIEKTDNPVKRDYSRISEPEKTDLLRKYDTAPMEMQHIIKRQTHFNTTVETRWRLGDRSGTETIQVPVASSGNWKFYVGVAVGAIVVGGAGVAIYKLAK